MPARLLHRYRSTSLGTRMAVASCLGIAAGVLLGERLAWLEPVGGALVEVLGLLAPLLVLALVPGALAAAGTAPLLGIAARVLSGFGLVASAAAGIGLAAGLVLGPSPPVAPWPDAGSPAPSWSQLGSGWWPGAWTAERAVPAAFLLALGAALAVRLWALRSPATTQPALRLLTRLGAASQRAVALLLECSPPCLFVLAAVTTSRLGPELAATGAQGFLAVFAAHATLCLLLVAVSPRPFLGSCQEALWTALATGSSAATLPVELRAVERGLGVEARLARVLVPLGVAASKAGTTAFLAALTVVAGRAAGVELTLEWLCRAALLVVAAGVLTPPVAGGGILMLGILFGPLGLPVELASLLGAVPFLGRLNTPLNALARLVVTRVVTVRAGAPASESTGQAWRA